ncbi:hypothetical protein SOVF_207210, partial [Spinacia oleracea]
VNYTS